jgi:hypothetical protein
MENEFASLTTLGIERKPLDVILDLDEFYGHGVKSFQVTLSGKKYMFTLKQIQMFFEQLSDDLK